MAAHLPPSRDESAQLGFRLAKTAGAKGVYGIDVDGEFPFDPVKAYADAHGTSALLDEQGAAVDRSLAREGALLAQKGVSAALRYLNDPARLRWDNAFYRTTLRIGGGQDQPGADLLAAWYRAPTSSSSPAQATGSWSSTAAATPSCCASA